MPNFRAPHFTGLFQVSATKLAFRIQYLLTLTKKGQQRVKASGPPKPDSNLFRIQENKTKQNKTYQMR